MHGQPKLHSALGTARVPLKSKHAGVVYDDISILYPHRLFATLYGEYPQHFLHSVVVRMFGVLACQL